MITTRTIRTHAWLSVLALMACDPNEPTPTDGGHDAGPSDADQSDADSDDGGESSDGGPDAGVLDVDAGACVLSPEDPGFLDTLNRVVHAAAVHYATCNVYPDTRAYEFELGVGERLRSTTGVSLDCTRLGSCLAALEAAPCDVYATLESRCEGLFVPPRSVGEPCSSSVECPEDSDCRPRPEDSEWACTARVAVGEDCSEAGCLDGARCVEARTDEGEWFAICRLPVALGGECDDAHWCARDLFCEADATGAGTCRAMLVSADGGPCEQFTGFVCMEGSFCSLTEPFVCRPPPELGEACEEVSYTDDCPEGAHCESGICIADLAEGEECLEQFDCADGWCWSGVCEARALIGEACDMPRDCWSWTCDDGVCVPAPPD